MDIIRSDPKSPQPYRGSYYRPLPTRQRLYSALLDAFDRENLAHLLQYYFDKKLEHIASKYQNERKTVSAVIDEACREGWVTQLVEAAQDYNPSNVILNRLIPDEFAVLTYPETNRSIKSDPTRKQRGDYLKRFKTLWIENRLHSTLPERIHLEMKIDELPKLNANYDLRYDYLLQDRQITVDSGKELWKLFVENGNAMLILGEPGSGKTTTLLQLAEQLMQRADSWHLSPIPIVLNLSSWATERLVMKTWIADELVRYNLVSNHTLVDSWLSNGQIVVLLDALDEVAEFARLACLEAINALRASSRRVDIVVSCREKEFQELSSKLNANYAIRLRLYEPTEIIKHLSSYTSCDMSGVIEAVQDKNSSWDKLLNVPLTLTMAVLALDGVSAERLLVFTNTDVARQHLFHLYTRRMLQRRPLANTRYASSEALHWLSCLAKGMSNHEQTSFFIEWLQPTWLNSRQHRYWRTLNSMMFGAFFGVLSGLLFWQLSSEGIKIGFVLGIVIGLLKGWLNNIIILREYIRWKWNLFGRWGFLIRRREQLMIGVLIGSIVGLILGQIVGLITGSIIGFIIWLQNLKLEMRTISTLEIPARNTPNQGIYATIKNGLISILISGMTFALIGNLLGNPILGLNIGLILGLGISRMNHVISHYILRLTLTYSRILPHGFNDRQLINFLDTMIERIFIKRIGGGWGFVHRYMQEYFASLTSDDIERIANEI